MFKTKDKKKLEQEKTIQKNINTFIDNKQSLVFKAGAGAGKTYALIESIKSLLKKEGSRLKTHNQKIVVITFTNVAADEIKNRLGQSDLVLVSTIHERLWDLIKVYQRELVDIHLKKLERELVKVKESISGEERFMGLKISEQTNFIKVMNDNKDVFYAYYEAKATKAKNKYKNLPFSFDIDNTKLLNNIGRFRFLVSNLYRRKRYKNAVAQIKNRKEGYKTVQYNTQLSHDRLEHMQISHDTLLKYAKLLIKKHQVLQKIIIHKYPYFFVDEYQDTSPLVIDILQILDNFSQTSKHDFFVGYYGDELQNIYNYGVGQELSKHHSNLKEVNKPLNRRSTQEVISVINRIRNEPQTQESIYTDSIGGSVKFYHGERNSVVHFIEDYKKHWKIDMENPLDCLFLTNRGVANNIGIPNLYNAMRQSNLYREGFGYERINMELLSKEFDKLGVVQKTLYNLFKLLSIIDKKTRTVNKILVTESIRRNISLESLNNLIHTLENIKGDTLGEILKSIDKKYQESSNDKFKLLINYLLNLDERLQFSKKEYKKFLFTTLGKINTVETVSEDEEDERLARANKTIEELLSISKDELLAWSKFLTHSEGQSVRYHTYHGTKGLEFKNVIIVMEHKFGRHSYFEDFFKNNLREDTLDIEELVNFNKAKNLLYVAASRAIINLRVFYIDDITELIPGVKSIFGKPSKYPKDEDE